MPSYRDVYGRIVDPSGDPLGINKPAASADITGLQDQATRGAAGSAGIASERARLGLDKTQQNQSSQEQADAVRILQGAAAGAPSPAQTQLQDQAKLDAARQIGLAKAIPGHSAGGTARTTAMGVANVGAHAADAGRLLSAQEQTAARGQLAGALQDTRTQDLTAYKTDQAARDANMAALLQQRQIAAQTAAAQAQANALAAGGENAKNAAVIGAAGAGGSQLISDERAKRNIRMAREIRGGY